MDTSRIILFLSFFVGVGVIGYLLVERGAEQKIKAHLVKENRAKKEEVLRLKTKTEELEKSLEEGKEASPPSTERMAEVFGEEVTLLKENTDLSMLEMATTGNETTGFTTQALSRPLLNCRTLESRIRSFFTYLDKKNYPFREGSFLYFEAISAKLSKKLPIPGEIFNAEDILSNAFHLYRATSKSDITLVKSILRKEKDTIEETMDYFYQHLSRCQNNPAILPSLDIMYEYAHFFLNTMGGRAYLFRLKSGFRTILLYYSTLIVHEANLREINRYGLDIRPYLEGLEDELKSIKKLYYSQRYLDILAEIKEYYR